MHAAGPIAIASIQVASTANSIHRGQSSVKRASPTHGGRWLAQTNYDALMTHRTTENNSNRDSVRYIGIPMTIWAIFITPVTPFQFLGLSLTTWQSGCLFQKEWKPYISSHIFNLDGSWQLAIMCMGTEGNAVSLSWADTAGWTGRVSVVWTEDSPVWPVWVAGCSGGCDGPVRWVGCDPVPSVVWVFMVTTHTMSAGSLPAYSASSSLMRLCQSWSARTDAITVWADCVWSVPARFFTHPTHHPPPPPHTHPTPPPRPRYTGSMRSCALHSRLTLWGVGPSRTFIWSTPVPGGPGPS